MLFILFEQSMIWLTTDELLKLYNHFRFFNVLGHTDIICIKLVN